ncbi:MAG: discoidin domain-containing protein [Candidatus Obscuribacterales bacterium]|jgi:hypothetical protein|nr:discoidin domain-containing protein [Candidatus Obscuribacterales bacterium]
MASNHGRFICLTLGLLFILAQTVSYANTSKQARPKALEQPKTYCNPLNLDYAFTPKMDYSENNCHRSTADPVCIMYKGKYYLFSTNQYGYWWSDDLGKWNFVSHLFKVNANNDQVCAPAAWPSSSGILFLPCFSEGVKMPLYQSTEPQKGVWSEATDAFPLTTWDPSLFEDSDGKLYVYWGSSNLYPLYGAQIDPKNGYKPVGKVLDLMKLQPNLHGWEQFGEDNQNGTMDPFIEGAWMNKFKGKYYLQYGAPGSEWNVYGDGVYVADKPLGPFKYQAHNPFAFKPTGFARGAGHGSTFVDKYDNVWHIATNVIAVKHKFERRLGLYPSGVDKDGVLFCDTSFGDYPHKLPNATKDPHSQFSNWMLLSYKKAATASSSKEKNDPSLAFDEDIKTYWAAKDGKPGQWLSVDLGARKNVCAIQVNYADDEATLYGKATNIHHRYKIYDSLDGEHWNLLVDKSTNTEDIPHDYIELSAPLATRYLKIENVEMPTGNFALGDLRIFGSASGAAPQMPQGFTAVRGDKDRRNVTISWKTVPNAYAYEILYGVAPNKLYSSLLVHDANHYDSHALNIESPYYFQIRAVGESGMSKPSAIIAAK